MNPLTLCSLLGCSLVLCCMVRADNEAAPIRPPGQSSSPIALSLQPFVDRHDIAGAVAYVASRDKVLALDVVGQSNIAHQSPMRPDDIFWIASMTKPIVGTAILMLEEEGKLSVDDPVGKYIPELAHLKTADGKTPFVTLKHLLTHTSGMVGEATDAQRRSAGTLADLIPIYANHPLQFEPGSKWEYCQSGINSLGRIIEIVSGETLPEFLQKRIFEPLGMKDTTFYLNEEQAGRLATSYALENGELHEKPIWILSGHAATSRDRYPAANGGLFSTAADYGTFLRMILGRGTLDGKTLLKPETVEKMTRIQSGNVVTGFTPGNGWGLGWCVVKQPQGVTAMLLPGACGHGGAYGTQAWIDPTRGLVFVMLVQRTNFPNGDASDERKAFQQAAVDTFGKAAAEASSRPGAPIAQAADGSILLHARDAAIHGKTVRYEPSPRKNTIGYWTDMADWVSWNFHVTRPGKFAVSILQGAGAHSGGAEVEFSVDSQIVKTTVEDTGGFQNFVSRDIGELELSEGDHTLNVKPITKPGVAVMDLRQVLLTPKK